MGITNLRHEVCKILVVTVVISSTRGVFDGETWEGKLVRGTIIETQDEEKVHQAQYNQALRDRSEKG